MSTSTPSLQTRSQYNRDWGNFANAAGLPNAASNSLANPYFTQLEVGDTAYVTGTSTKYVCTLKGTLSGADATWTALSGSSPSSNLLFAWNRTDLSQFNIASPFTTGTPVNPQIQFVNGGIQLSLDTGTGANSQAAWYCDTPVNVTWGDVREIELAVSASISYPHTDVFEVGIFVAADPTYNTGISYTLSDLSVAVRLSNGSGGGAGLFSFPISMSYGVSLLQTKYIVNSLDTSTYTPNGVPSYLACMTYTGLPGTTAVSHNIFSNQAVGFAGPDWGPANPSKFAILLRAPSGVSDPAGLGMSINAINFKS